MFRAGITLFNRCKSESKNFNLATTLSVLMSCVKMVETYSMDSNATETPTSSFNPPSDSPIKPYILIPCLIGGFILCAAAFGVTTQMSCAKTNNNSDIEAPRRAMKN